MLWHGFTRMITRQTLTSSRIPSWRSVPVSCGEKGLNNTDATSVKNGNFIPEPQTDFIFAVAGEELGFIGTVIIIILLLFITIECILIARKAKDTAGKMICCGFAALVGFQSLVNIGVASGVLPNTGLPLPFVSYGLTSLLSLYIGVGLVLNVGLQPKKY